jgi:hypothetical protein
MKGFPNQLSDIAKLTRALQVVAGRIARDESLDDDPLGEALLRADVLGTGRGRNAPSIDAYLATMRTKRESDQSHRTSARGIKEFFRRAGALRSIGAGHEVTDTAQGILATSGDPASEAFRLAWRLAMAQVEAVSQGWVSHPYNVMLRLIGQRPGIPRALCALALEAQDDSDGELSRIAGLVGFGDEDQIRLHVGASQSNWDNAKKILPSIAEQLNDVARGPDHGLHLTIAGQQAAAVPAANVLAAPVPARPPRRVTSGTIANTAFDPMDEERLLHVAEIPDPAVRLNAVVTQRHRTHAHQLLVKQLAATFIGAPQLWEGVFDCLAEWPTVLVLAEVKTLDGTPDDEVRQVRDALSQLLYYQHFSIPSQLGGRQSLKIACFSQKPSDGHIVWLRAAGIHAVWKAGSGFSAAASTIPTLSQHMGLVVG